MALSNIMDFLTHTVVQTFVRFTVTAAKVLSVNISNSQKNYTYKSFGAGFWEEDFNIQGALTFGGAVSFQLFFFNILTNTHDDARSNQLASVDQFGIRLGSDGVNLQLQLTEISSGSMFSSSVITPLTSTKYYFEQRLVKADSAFGTLYLELYTDASRTILFDSTSLELKSLTSYEFYLAQQNYRNFAGGSWPTLEIEDVSYSTPGIPVVPTFPPTSPDVPNFFRIFKHLLPRAKAWRLSGTKQLTQFFKGLTGIGDDLKNFYDLIWLDIFPETTRELSAWEKQFGLPNTVLTEQERRDRLISSWQALGGQSPRYIQDALQQAGFDVYLHEWWELPATYPPVARNPFIYLNDGTTDTIYVFNDGALTSNDGAVEANDGATLNPTGYVLVNKISLRQVLGDGAANFNDGAVTANDGATLNEYSELRYILPTDITTWPYFLYIGGQTFPNRATIPASRRNEFETLCLKLCPTQQWLGILVDYA